MKNLSVCNEKGWLTNPSMELVKAQPCEKLGNRHNPIPHVDAIELLHESLDIANIEGANPFSMMSKNGMRMLYIVEITADESDFTWMFGMANCNDRSRAYVDLLGEKLFVCSNMQFSCQLDFLKRRHSGDIHNEILEKNVLALEIFKGFVAERSANINRLKECELSDAKAGELILNLHRDGTIGNANINRIVKEYDEPRHEDFAPRTAWSFQNACTEIFKVVDNPMLRLDSMKVIDKAFEKVLDIPVIDVD